MDIPDIFSFNEIAHVTQDRKTWERLRLSVGYPKSMKQSLLPILPPCPPAFSSSFTDNSINFYHDLAPCLRLSECSCSGHAGPRHSARVHDQQHHHHYCPKEETRPAVKEKPKTQLQMSSNDDPRNPQTPTTSNPKFHPTAHVKPIAQAD